MKFKIFSAILSVAILVSVSASAFAGGGKKMNNDETFFVTASFIEAIGECLAEYTSVSGYQFGEANTFAWIQYQVRDTCSDQVLYQAWGGVNPAPEQFAISYPDSARMFAVVYMWDQFSFEPTPATVELFWGGDGFRDEFPNPWERFDGKKRIARGAFPNGFRQAVPSGRVLFGGVELTEGAFPSGQISHSSGEYPPPLPVPPGAPAFPPAPGDKG